MSIRFSTSEPSEKISDHVLLGFHKQSEAACLQLQEHLDEGIFSLSNAVAKIRPFTERVQSLGKKYQEEKQSSMAPLSLYQLQEEFLKELKEYNATYLKTVILLAKTQNTILFIQPAHRSRSDDKSIQQNLPFYYAELKVSEEIFLNYSEQLKKTQTTLSNLNHQLSAAINGKGLKMALDKFNKIVEHQGTLSSKHRLLSHISPTALLRPAIIIEPQEQPILPMRSPRPRASPLLFEDPQPASKSIPHSSIHKQTVSSPEFLCSLSREPQKKRLSTSSQETLDASSARIEVEALSASSEIRQLSPPQRRGEISPARNITLRLSPRDLGRSPRSSPRLEPFTRLTQSDGSSSFREVPTTLGSSSPRDRYTRFSHSLDPSYLLSREAPRTLLLPTLHRKYEQDTPSPERSRMTYRRTYENVGDAPPYSGSHY